VFDYCQNTIIVRAFQYSYDNNRALTVPTKSNSSLAVVNFSTSSFGKFNSAKPRKESQPNTALNGLKFKSAMKFIIFFIHHHR